jgi:replication factor A1
MAIKDLKANTGKNNITAVVTEKGDIREFEKFGRKGRVCNAVIKDETGSVKLTLWNEDADKIEKGDKIRIDNGWVREWQGELQLSTGKFGKIEVIEKGVAIGNEATEDEKAESEILNNKKKDYGEKVLTEDEKAEEEDLEELNEEPPLDEETSENEKEEG